MPQSRDVLPLTQNSDQTLHRYQIHISKKLNNTKSQAENVKVTCFSIRR